MRAHSHPNVLVSISKLSAAFVVAILIALIASSNAGAKTISTGEGFSCAIDHAGGVDCWGSNGAGQLGNGTGVDSSVPVNVVGISSGATAVSAGRNLSCAIVSGAARCWGDGQTTPLTIAGMSTGVTAIDVGVGYACAVVSGAAKCWGSVNGRGQLGNGTTTPSSVPVQVTGLTSGVTAIAAGDAFTCAIVAGSVKCWGWGEEGRLGNGDTSDSLAPVQVTGMTSGVTAISAGTFHACAIVSNAAKCWGSNSSGQLGDGHDSDEVGHAWDEVPVQVVGLTTGVTAISVGRAFTCAIVSSGALCWGANSYGQLGNGTKSATNVPSQVTGLTSGVSSISAGGWQHSCAVVSGVAKCWGDNANGAFGNGVTAIAPVPVQVPGLTSGTTSIAAGDQHTCAVISGAAKCWGANEYGQLGNGTNTNSNSPVQVTGLTSGVTAISVEVGHSCAIVSGAAKCWGLNGDGQLGNGVTGTGSSVPVQVTGLTSGVTAISVGGSHSCAVVSGAAKCWGDGSNYRLINGSVADSNVPVQATGLTSGVTAISAHIATCVVHSGAVKCGGWAVFGGIGDGTGDDAPVAVQTLGQTTGGMSVATGLFQSCAVMSNALNCWGPGKPAPVQLAGLTSGVTAVGIGSTVMCALQSAGVKCWGDNDKGQLGNGTLTNSPTTPTQVTGLTSNVTAISAGYEHACAIKSGAAMCWGSRYAGQLGDGGNGYSVTPVSVPNFYPLGSTPPDTTAPVISNPSPANGSSTTSTSVALTFTATDNSGAAPTCTPASGSTIALNLGANAIVVSCKDAANNTATTTVNITRTVPDPIPDTTPPVISGIAPAGGSSTANGSVVLTYAASDNSGIAPVCTPASGATHALVVGSNSILITCTDASNNQATATVVITRTAIVITTPPPEPTPDTTAPIVATKTLISGKPKFATNRRSASTTYVCAKATCVVTLKITIAKKRYSVKSKPLPISSSDTPVKAMIKMPSTLAKKLVAAKKKRQKVTLKAVIA